MVEKKITARSAILEDTNAKGSIDANIKMIADRLVDDAKALRDILEELERGNTIQAMSLADNAAAENINKGTETVNGAKLTDGTVSGAKLAANAAAENINKGTTAVSGAKLTAGSVDATRLAANAAVENINNARNTVLISGARISGQSIPYDKLQSTCITSPVATIDSGKRATILTVRLTPSAVTRPITVHYYSPDAVTTIYDSARPDSPFGYHGIIKLPTGSDYQLVADVHNQSTKPVRVVACVSYWG